MAIIFHEGLPGAGKSYAAFKDFIIPALQKGREVYAYIEGIDHARIAEASGLPVETVTNLLHPLTREQVPEIYNHVKNDAFVVIDELQNFFPSQRQPLSPQMTQFITEHRHLGIDILCMGQNLKDCHNTWRRRMAQKVYFFKREALGRPDEYQMIVYKPVPHKDDLRWEEVSKKAEPYDPKYFGCYKSHTDETTNKETLVDQRAVIWNNPMFKKWLPLYGVILVAAIGFIVYLFSGGLATGPAQAPVAQGAVKPAAKPAPQPLVQPLPHPPVQPVAHQSQTGGFLQPSQVQESKSLQGDRSVILPAPLPDAIDRLSQSYRVRLAGFIESSRGTEGFIEWRNDGFDVVERMTFTQLRGLGWMVMLDSKANLAFLQKYDSRYIVTSWPIPEPRGEVSRNTVEGFRPSTPTASAVAVEG